MIFNYWLWVSNAMYGEIEGKFVDPRAQTGPTPPEVSTNAIQFPLLNVLNEPTDRALLERSRGEDSFLADIGGPGYRTISVYTQSPGLAEQVPIREQLQELGDTYPDDFLCIGSWNFDGSPIGGVGSPWFQTPPELKPETDVILRAGTSAEAVHMSLQVFTRTGVFRVTPGSGEVTSGIDCNGFRILPDGTVAGQLNGSIDHYHNGFPFNLHGRLLIGGGAPTYYHNGIPFTATGMVSSLQGAPVRTDQGHPYEAADSIARN